MSKTDRPHLNAWLGRVEQRSDTITPVPAMALSATLDREADTWHDGAALPPLWHWLYFLPLAQQREIGADGHPRRGGFLPPVPLPRRMWAGGRLEFHRPLCIGEAVTRASQIADVSEKCGKSGALVFVRVRHEIANEGGVALTEEHDIVYREPPAPDAAQVTPPAAPRDEGFARTVTPDPVLLFRYSALTFNGHRIHYDRSYVTGVEGYPGLVVHGPLIATLLADLLQRQQPERTIARFAFKAVSPLFDGAPFELCGRFDDDHHFSLWARNASGALAMQAEGTLA